MTTMRNSRAESAPPTRGHIESRPKPVPVPTTTCTTTRPSNGIPPIRKGRSSTSKRPKRMLRRDPFADRCSIAMSRAESVLVSAAGDVIVCRCRRSSTPYISSAPCDSLDPWSSLIPCCETEFITGIEGPWSPVFENLTVNRQQVSESTSQTSEVSTYEWEKMDKQHLITANGLKGGAMPDPKTSDVKVKQTRKNTSTPKQKSNSEASSQSQIHHDGSPTILPLPSFDYSHMHDGHNDMVPLPPRPEDAAVTPIRRKIQSSFPTILESPENKDEQDEITHQKFFHGVPIFLSTLSQVRITKVSANPLGAHVLLISAECLLFAYGLNNHGQLGIGIKSQLTDGNRGFTTTPTLITPLLENGGKAINCAAGIDHSLVVVATEGRRVQKSYTNPNVAYSGNGGAIQLSRVTSSPCRISTDGHDDDGNDLLLGGAPNESVQHHQLYGFGSNDFMKLGLVSATLSEDGEEGAVQGDTLLPHRVALHCTLWPSKGSSSSSSSYPPQGIFDIAASAEHSAALVRRATGAIEVYTWGNATLGALGLPVTKDPTVKIQGSPSRKPTLNANSIFPLPTVLESLSYGPNADAPFPREIALGPYCSFVVMSNGRCYSFGFSAEGMLGQGDGITHSMAPKEVCRPAIEKGKGNGIVSVSAGAFHAIAVTENGHAYSWGINLDDRLGLGMDEFVKRTSSTPKEQKNDKHVIEWVPQYVDVQEYTSLSCQATAAEDSTSVVRACAGYDASLLVMRSGQVLSFGKRSGRMGKGEVASNVAVPKPLFGGLRLFHNNESRQLRRWADAKVSS